MAKTMTFLQLSQEFGGTRFGPFESVEIRLGSDPDNSDITLPATLGVAPQHVKVLKQQDESYILAPVERTAAVYYFRASGGKGKQVTAPLACKSGDSFSLVTPEGPRFFIHGERDKKAIEAAAKDSEGPGWPNINAPQIRTEGIVREIKRRGFAAVFSTRLGNMWMRTWAMIKTGQIFSPRYIVAGMLLLSGYLFTFGSCGALYRTNSAKKSYQKHLTTCRDTCGYDEESNEGDPTFAQLTKNLLVDTSWKSTIEQDAILREAFANELRVVYAEPQRYAWVYKRENSPYSTLKTRLDNVGLPENLVRAMAFAATRGRFDQAWHKVVDSEGVEVCGRGPLALTYRMGRHLGLVQLQPDALVDSELAASNDVLKQRAKLDETLATVNEQPEYRDDLIVSSGAELQGGRQCLFIDGIDDRDNISEIADALRRRLGGGTSKMLGSSEGGSYWIAHRLVALFAHDFRYDLDAVTFDNKNTPSIALQLSGIPEGRQKFAIREAAGVMARALAIPCMARFDKDIKEPPPWLVKEAPQLGQCAILKAYVEYDRLE